MSMLRTRIILWRSGLLVMAVGAGLAAALLWRPGLPWPGSMPVAQAALLQQLPRDLLLERCRDNTHDFHSGPDVKAAMRVAARPETVRLDATVWNAWGAPWHLQVYDRSGKSYVGRFEITNWDTFSMPREGPSAPHPSPAPQIRLTETLLAPATASKFEGEWRRSVDSAQAPQTLGRDGTHYYFRIDGACATTWSPGEGTRSAALADLLEAVGAGADDARLGALLDAIPPPAETIPWPPIPDQAD